MLTAQRRDISDPKTVRDFVELVQSPEMLRLLVILTVADIRAVGPGMWNGWKGQLLRELYYAADSMMTGGDQAPSRTNRVAPRTPDRKGGAAGGLWRRLAPRCREPKASPIPANLAAMSPKRLIGARPRATIAA